MNRVWCGKFLNDKKKKKKLPGVRGRNNRDVQEYTTSWSLGQER